MRNLSITLALVLGSLMTQAQTVTVGVAVVTINVNQGYVPPTTYNYTPSYSDTYTPYQAALDAKERVREAKLARQAEAIWKDKVSRNIVVPSLNSFTLMYIRDHSPKLNLFGY